jgi:mannan endo-1,4-beta-mannosidase
VSRSSFRCFFRAKRPRTRAALVLFVALTLLPGCTFNRQSSGAKSGQAQDLRSDEEGATEEPLVVERTKTPSPYFVRGGQPFCFLGANNYYLMYKSEFAQRSVLDSAQAMNLGMLRMWAFIDRGSLDGSIGNVHGPGHADGIYFQYWDKEAQKPAYNDGADGLEKLDFVLAEARARGLTLTLVLTNNWRDFGGMDQYLTWYGLKQHHEFYTDSRVRQAYKAWIHHLVNRVNSRNGVPYKDDPTIFAWELANEPRAINYEDMDSQSGWNTETITAWAAEMSAYVKSLDPNHMVAVGDEGFLSRSEDDWAYNGSLGVDGERLTTLPHVDFGTYHLYPDHWRKWGKSWSRTWIEEHIKLGRRANKPMILEEYGLRVRRDKASRKQGQVGRIVRGFERRAAAYTNWNNLLREGGGQAGLFWLLSGYEAPDQLYPDYDGFTVYEGDASYALLQPFSEHMSSDAAACTLAQGADHGEASPFVKVRPAPKKEPSAAVSPAPSSPKIAELWPRGSRARTF